LLNADKKIVITDSLSLKEAKTKTAIALLKQYGAETKKVLLVTEKIEPELVLANRNLSNVIVVTAANLSILPLSRAELVIMERSAAVNHGLAKTAPAKVAQV